MRGRRLSAELPNYFMTMRFCVFASVMLAVFLSSCASNEEVQKRVDARNEGYQKYQDRRQIREQGRDERYDAWFNRIMN